MPTSDWHQRNPDRHRESRTASARRARGGLKYPPQTCHRCGRLVGSSPSGLGLSAHKDPHGQWCR